MRSTRKQYFCWQEKKVLRLLRKEYKKTELVKLRCLYGAITEMDSDFNSQDIKYYTKTIHTYSGLSKDWIPTGLKSLEKLGIIKIVEERKSGKFKGKTLIFTPENIKEMPRKTVTGKSAHGETVNDKNDTSEDSILSEDSTGKEESFYNNINDDLVNEIYKLYPSRCIIKNRSTGKSHNNKDKIRKLLKKGVDLKKIINRYISECSNSKSYMMNFKTFLNNLPDYSEVTEYKKPNIEFDETDYLDRMADEGLKKVNETFGRKNAV